MAYALSGCRAVGFVFKAGVWTAIIGIALLFVIGFGIAKAVRRPT